MLENMDATLSRIDEIKSHFYSRGVSGVVSTSPHAAVKATSNRVASAQTDDSLQPFFPDYLAKAIKEKTNASSGGASKYDDIIQSAAAKNGVDPDLLKALIHAESGFNANAVSHSGAQGLTQLMPRTAAALGVSNPFDPEQSINAGAKYLKHQINRFGDEKLALAAYNAGAGAVARYGGVPPYRETQNYVNKVLSYRNTYSSR